MVNELRNIYKRDIPDEDVRRAFKAQLTNASKNNFLQLENMPEYGNNVNSLCLEIIRRDEELEQNLEEIVAVNYVEKQDWIHGVCFKCGKPGHKMANCRTHFAKKPYFDKRKNLQVTIDGNTNNKNNANVQANLAKTANDPDKDKATIQCYICHARGDHDSFGCPNGTVTVKLKNRSFEANELKNARKDAANPNKKYLVS